MTKLPLLVLLPLVGLTSTARAATFTVTIKNTSQVYMAPGVLTLSPLINIAPAPAAGTKQFAVIEYARLDCDQPDSFCPSGSDFWCHFANETTLIGRMGLTRGVDAWVPVPPGNLPFYNVPVFAPGDSATVTITAEPGQKLSYLTKAGDFNTYDEQIVMMHATGNPADLAVPLFDGNGYPLASVTFDLGGYSVSSSSASNGTAGECSSFCPLPNGQSTGCFVALGSSATGSELPGQPTSATLGKGWTWSAPAGYTTDAMALGDLTSSSGNEIVVELESNQANGVGRAVVLSSAGAQLSAFDGLVPGNDFMGFPLIESLGGSNGYLVAELGDATPPGAAVYARTGSSAVKWTSTGYGFPGMWNMGPSSGTVNGANIVIADYDGDVQLLNPANGAALGTFNLFAATQDHPYGHAAVGDVHTNSGNEVVLFGGVTGKIYVLSYTGGALKLVYTSAAPLNGGYAFGSGPAIADLDAASDRNGKPEIIVATAGSAAVYAYNTADGGRCRYKWSNPGGFDYSWSSPVVGDLDGDGKPEIVVLSSDSVLSVLKVPPLDKNSCTEGVVAWTYEVGNGGPAWFTPALANLTGGSGLDIVAANYQTLEVLDFGIKGPVWRHSEKTAQFYPSAIIDRGNTNAPASIIVPGWIDGKVYQLTTPKGSTMPTAPAWPTFMGSNARTGAK